MNLVGDQQSKVVDQAAQPMDDPTNAPSPGSIKCVLVFPRCARPMPQSAQECYEKFQNDPEALEQCLWAIEQLN